MIYSVDLSRNGTDLLNVKKQCIALVLACALAFFVTRTNYQFLEHYRFWLYVLGILLLVSVLFFGYTIRGARGWYVFGSFSFQPVEFMKAATIVMLASYFSRRARRFFGWKEFFESFLIAVIPVIFILFQPDFGSAAVIIGMWFILALFAGMSKQHIFTIVTVGIVGFVGMVYDGDLPSVISKPYLEAKRRFKIGQKSVAGQYGYRIDDL